MPRTNQFLRSQVRIASEHWVEFLRHIPEPVQRSEKQFPLHQESACWGPHYVRSSVWTVESSNTLTKSFLEIVNLEKLGHGGKRPLLQTEFSRITMKLFLAPPLEGFLKLFVVHLLYLSQSFAKNMLMRGLDQQGSDLFSASQLWHSMTWKGLVSSWSVCNEHSTSLGLWKEQWKSLQRDLNKAKVELKCRLPGCLVSAQEFKCDRWRKGRKCRPEKNSICKTLDKIDCPAAICPYVMTL